MKLKGVDEIESARIAQMTEAGQNQILNPLAGKWALTPVAKSFEKTLEDFYNYDIFKDTYLINMETRRDRHLFMDYKLKNMGINYKRIPGVIGKHFEEEFNEFITNVLYFKEILY